MEEPNESEMLKKKMNGRNEKVQQINSKRKTETQRYGCNPSCKPWEEKKVLFKRQMPIAGKTTAKTNFQPSNKFQKTTNASGTVVEIPQRRRAAERERE